MFHLEDSIADWRRQMRAAGINTPVPLEELESHLRDDVEQQERSGLSTRQAFEAAVQRIGQAGEIKSEFEIASSNIINPDQVMKQRIRNILVIIAVLAIGVGLALPVVAKWRAHETLVAFDITMLVIGTAIVAWGALCAAWGIFRRSKA